MIDKVTWPCPARGLLFSCLNVSFFSSSVGPHLRLKNLDFGFHFHLSAFQWIVVSSERSPADSFGIRWMWSIKIQSVDIRGVTSSVPPRSLKLLSAAVAIQVIVVIFRRKLHRITSRKERNFDVTKIAFYFGVLIGNSAMFCWRSANLIGSLIVFYSL